MRPERIGDLVGQSAFAPGSPLQHLLEKDSLPSLILWGPPGCGKTSLANVIRAQSSAHWEPLSATSATVKDIRAAGDKADERLKRGGRRTLLFVDEVHR